MCQKRENLKSAEQHAPVAPTKADDPGRLITKEEVRQRLGLPSTRMVDALMRQRKIPFLRLGHRTIRFDWRRVITAIEKLELKEVGRK